MPKRVVLLGAGASKEAGVPTTVEMTRQIVEAVNKSSFATTAAALNFVCGQITAYDTAEGASPYEGLDIERVYSAVALLAGRDDLEVTPFVSAWHPKVDAIDSGSDGSLPPFWSSDFRKAIEADRGFRLERAFRKGVEAITRSTSRGVYEALLNELTTEVRRLAHVDDGSDAAYLEPLVALGEPGPLTIATLNYDRAIEMVGAERGVRVDTGIEGWVKSGQWSWARSGIRLLKLHGSVDWCWSEAATREGQLPEEAIVVSSDSSAEMRSPAVIFGQRGKLRADGPFLELLAEFDRALQLADELLVIGYSFRDDHVNEYVKRWLNGSASHRLVVVDPSFPDEGWWNSDDFRAVLIAALAPSRGDSRKHRLNVVRENASRGIPMALQPRQ